jgi:integrase
VREFRTPGSVRGLAGDGQSYRDFSNWNFLSHQARNALTMEIKRAVKKAGLMDFRLHDLRHSFATVLRSKGYGLDLIAKLLGHSDLRMTQRYAHVGDDLLMDAARAMAGTFPTEVHEAEQKKMAH